MATRSVVVVDDDEAVREALSWLFEGAGLTVEAFDAGETLLDGEAASRAGCLVLDMRLSGMSGLLLFEKLLVRGYCPPVVFLTGHADVPLAVAALKMGAADFLEKPFDDELLLQLVRAGLAEDGERRQAWEDRARVDRAVEQLTEREREVMQLVLAGKLNKQIAEELDISIKTVEVHRARLLDKMGVKSAVELAGMVKKP